MQISTPRSSSAQQVRGLELMNGTLFAPSRPLVAKLSSMIKKLFSGFTCRPMVVVFHDVDDDEDDDDDDGVDGVDVGDV